MFRNSVTVGLVSTAVLFLAAPTVSALDDVPPHVAAAQRREATVKTLVVEFEQSEVVAKGSRSHPIRTPLKSEPEIPGEDITFSSVNRLVIDGDKFRYESNHPRWDAVGQAISPMHQIDCYDGTLVKALWPSGFDGQSEPVGLIDSSTAVSGMNSSIMAPIVLTYRPTARALHGDISELSATGSTLLIAGELCEEYRQDAPKATATFWLSPQNDYVVRRIARTNDNHLDYQMDIDYRQDEAGAWIPKSWVENQYSSMGMLLTSIKVKVLKIEFNEPQAPEEFELDFPPNTRLFDRINNKYYLVQNDNKMREVSSSWEDLPRDSWIRRHSTLIGGIVLVGVVGLGLLAHRLRRKHLPKA